MWRLRHNRSRRVKGGKEKEKRQINISIPFLFLFPLLMLQMVSAKAEKGIEVMAICLICVTLYQKDVIELRSPQDIHTHKGTHADVPAAEIRKLLLSSVSVLSSHSILLIQTHAGSCAIAEPSFP
jgi:hypothetical protein